MTFGLRSAFRCDLGKAKNVRSSLPASLRLVTTPGQRLAHARSKAVYAARATSASREEHALQVDVDDAFHCASVISTAGQVSGTPALLASTSRYPKAASTSAIARSMLARERTSSVTRTARAPALVIAYTVSARSSGCSSETATSHPSPASASALAAPIP